MDPVKENRRRLVTLFTGQFGFDTLLLICEEERFKYDLFLALWGPVLEHFAKLGIKFGLEVHPTEAGWDTDSAEMLLARMRQFVEDGLLSQEAYDIFGFNYDPSHLAWQGCDYVEFIYRLGDKIWHVHMKDVDVSEKPKNAGCNQGHRPFKDHRGRWWTFVSVGRGSIGWKGFTDIIRALNAIGYDGPLSVEWEDDSMHPFNGGSEAAGFVLRVDYRPSPVAFDAAMHAAKKEPTEEEVAQQMEARKAFIKQEGTVVRETIEAVLASMEAEPVEEPAESETTTEDTKDGDGGGDGNTGDIGGPPGPSSEPAAEAAEELPPTGPQPAVEGPVAEEAEESSDEEAGDQADTEKVEAQDPPTDSIAAPGPDSPTKPAEQAEAGQDESCSTQGPTGERNPAEDPMAGGSSDSDEAEDDEGSEKPSGDDGGR